MRNWLKTLWSDFGDKELFLYKYLIPGLAIFFTWGIVGHLMLISLDTSSLVKNTGRVTEITIKFEQGTKRHYKYYPLKISLSDFNEEFRLPDTYKDDFVDLQQKILIGDTIILYTRHQWQTILGWGKRIDIYHIDKDGHTLFDISKVINEKKSQATLLSFFSFVLWTWYIIYRRTRKA